MTPSLIRAYRRAGFLTDGEVLAAALLRGAAAFCEARALVEAGRESSTAMVIVPGTPPGKNVCAFIRRLVGDRSKLVVAAKTGDLSPGSFETMLRASMPDVEKKLRVMDVGDSAAEAVMSAERNRHYRPSQALEIFCTDEDARGFAQEVRGGHLNFDPSVISTVPTQVPSDDPGAILGAVERDDVDALHRVLDPHIFSSPDGLARYQSAMEGTSQRQRQDEGHLREGPWEEFFATKRLGEFPWEEDPDGEDPSGQKGPIEKWEKRIRLYDKGLNRVGDWIICGLTVDSMATWSRATGRGNPSTAGFMVDCEILSQKEPFGPERHFIYHVERRFSDVATARTYAARLRSFIDSKTLDGLSRQPRSGKMSMSKFERIKTPAGAGVGPVNELVGTQAAPQAGPQSQMRGSNSSAWSGGRLVLKKPENFIPDDENESERDRALDQDIVGGGLDWGVGLSGRGY